MKKLVFIACLVAAAAFSACSGGSTKETTATIDPTAPVDATAVDTTSLTADTTLAAIDSVRHAHLHESKGMVHNHEHAHPAGDTAHHGQ